MALNAREKTGLLIGGLAFLGITLWATRSDAAPKRDTPFCPPGPNGQLRQWNPDTQQCEFVDPNDPGFDPWKLPEDDDDPTPPDDDIFIPGVVIGDIDAIIKDFPEGNNFYQIKQGDILGWGLSPGPHWNAVTYRMLSRELFLAAKQAGGLTDEEAHAFAAQHRGRKANQNQLYTAIICSAMNDYAYGTWGYDGGINHPGPHGRAIRLLTQHANNRLRLASDLPMARTVSIRKPADKGKGNSNPVKAATPGGDNSYPLLWLPGVNRKVLWDSKGSLIQLDPDQANPPAWVTDRGVTDYSGSTLTKYGCGYGEIDFGE